MLYGTKIHLSTTPIYKHNEILFEYFQNHDIILFINKTGRGGGREIGHMKFILDSNYQTFRSPLMIT